MLSSMSFAQLSSPSSLKNMSAKQFMHNLSNVESIFEKHFCEILPDGDYYYLTDHKVLPIVMYTLAMSSPSILPISKQVMSKVERKFLLGSVLKSQHWGYLEMYLLLNDEILEFDANGGFNSDVINLQYRQHTDLLLSLLMSRCLKLRVLSLSKLSPSSLRLEHFCKSMPHMTKLDLSYILRDKHYGGVLKVIATKMPQLKSLDISFSAVPPSAMNYLLPTEDNPHWNLTELVFLNLLEGQITNAEFLKKIIIAFPKLQCLKHEMLTAALVDLTSVEMDMNTARCLEHLQEDVGFYYNENMLPKLPKAPVFERLCNITVVDIQVGEHSEPVLTDLLCPLKKLKALTVDGLSTFHEIFVNVLESIGEHLEFLKLFNVSGNLNVRDIMLRCPILLELVVDCPRRQIDDEYRVEKSNKQLVFHCLKMLKLQYVDKQVCNEETLISLLLSPRLQEIILKNVEVMSNEVMSNVMSAEGCSPLSTVNRFFLYGCESISAAPFVHWLGMEDTVLDDLHFEYCELEGEDVLLAAAEKYLRPLYLTVGPEDP